MLLQVKILRPVVLIGILVLSVNGFASEKKVESDKNIPLVWKGLWGPYNIEKGLTPKEYCKLIECSIVEQEEGKYEAKFSGECGRPYKYTITVGGRMNDGVLMFKGTVDLGEEDGGVYDWIGRATEKEFVGFYTNSHYVGTFSMSPAKKESATSQPNK